MLQSEREGRRRKQSLTFSCSVGKGPPPTLVVYALTTPIVLLMNLGGIPSPVHTPPIVAEEEVTKGYVPKSMSSMSALAPSTRMRLPEERAVWMYVTESMTCGFRRCARIYAASKGDCVMTD